jgi:hypothetical protein
VDLEQLFGMLREWMLAQITVKKMILISSSVTVKSTEVLLFSTIPPSVRDAGHALRLRVGRGDRPDVL